MATVWTFGDSAVFHSRRMITSAIEVGKTQPHMVSDCVVLLGIWITIPCLRLRTTIHPIWWLHFGLAMDLIIAGTVAIESVAFERS